MNTDTIIFAIDTLERFAHVTVIVAMPLAVFCLARSISEWSSEPNLECSEALEPPIESALIEATA